MTTKATELRKGMVLLKDGDLLLITDYNHATPGNLRAVIQIKTRSLTTGTTGQFRPAAGDQLEVAYLDKKPCQYLYQEGDGSYVFMDNASYEQFHIPADDAKDKMVFIKESDVVDITFHETTPIGIEVPSNVVLEVTESELAVKGNSATGVKKEAVLETGHKLKVPMHIAVGEKIKVSTSTGEFMGRASE